MSYDSGAVNTPKIKKKAKSYFNILYKQVANK